MSERAKIEIGLLGPLEVGIGGRPVAVGRPKQRALLAVLALAPGVCVSRERLVDELWGAAPPGSAAHALQVHVSGLRKLLGEGVVATCPGGYKLDVGPDAVDASRAAALVAAGEPAAALALFRGTPLEDVRLEGPSAREAERLGDLRVEALEQHFESELVAGRGAALVRQIERLVAEEPLRERARGQLMRALYQAGRQADALAAFQDARRTLVDELGIEPSPALRDLERAILQQELPLSATEPALDRAVSRDGRSRGTLLLAAALAALATAAGVLAAMGLPISNPSAARPRSKKIHETPSTVVAASAPTTTRKHHAATHRLVVHHTTPPRTPIVHKTSPASTVVPPPTTTVIRAVTPTVTVPDTPTTTAPKIVTHPIATTPRPPTATTTAAEPKGPIHIVDTFDTAMTDGATWNILINGSGTTIIQQNGKLLISIPAGATPGGSYNFVGAQYGTKGCFTGDIDMQVDYQLIQWPASSGAYVGLQAVFANALAERYWDPHGGGDQFASIIDPRFKGGIAPNGMSGSLRLTRIDGIATTYYLDDGSWQVMDSAPAPNPAHLHIGLSIVPGVSPSNDVTVALDNFSATASGPISGC